jgi:hypothetical protein
MANETFKKRQKEAARREKQKKKAARRLERRNERARGEKQVRGENPKIAEAVSEPEPRTL